MQLLEKQNWTRVCFYFLLEQHQLPTLLYFVFFCFCVCFFFEVGNQKFMKDFLAFILFYFFLFSSPRPPPADISPFHPADRASDIFLVSTTSRSERKKKSFQSHFIRPPSCDSNSALAMLLPAPARRRGSSLPLFPRRFSAHQGLIGRFIFWGYRLCEGGARSSQAPPPLSPPPPLLYFACRASHR